MSKKYTPREPTGDECHEGTILHETEYDIYRAIWYPQMGGYCAKAVAKYSKVNSSDSCLDMYIWHDGDFPFCSEDGSPAEVHHCSPEQFIEFGNRLREFLGPTEDVDDYD